MSQPSKCPLPRDAVVDRYFLEHRAKLIDIAAFLDRVDRAEAGNEKSDNRVVALRAAIPILLETRSGRAGRILEWFSDLSSDPAASSGGKGAVGVDPNREYNDPAGKGG